MLEGHTARVYSVAWSPDGKTLATGARDTTAALWDAATGRWVYMTLNHRIFIDSLVGSPDVA